MTLLSPDDVKRMKEINKRLQGKRLVGGPVDDIGPLDITIDNTLCDHREHNAEEILNEILDQIFIDIWGEYNTDHLGTFAEFKSIPEEKIINEYNKTPLIHAISSENVKAAIQKI